MFYLGTSGWTAVNMVTHIKAKDVLKQLGAEHVMASKAAVIIEVFPHSSSLVELLSWSCLCLPSKLGKFTTSETFWKLFKRDHHRLIGGSWPGSLKQS